MNTMKNKIVAITIAMFFILSMTASMTLIPNAKAAVVPNYIPATLPTNAYIAVSPNPIQLGQSVNVGFWLGQTPPTASGVFGDHWTNMTVKVTTPSQVTSTLGPFTSDDTGGTHTEYTATAVGNYTFQFIFGGQTILDKNPLPTEAINVHNFIGVYYEPSNSPVATLTVQSAPIPYIPENPLPTTYWTRPIESYNDIWAEIGGNWLGLAPGTFSDTGMYNATANYNPYTTAPLTAHIMWTQPVAFGGQVGGEAGLAAVGVVTSASGAAYAGSTSGLGTETSNFYSTSQYEPKFDPVIMNGILYYEQFPNDEDNPSQILAVNLQTGQQIWSDTNLTFVEPYELQQSNTAGGVPGNGVISFTTTILCGQIQNIETPNQFGWEAWLWLQMPNPQPGPLTATRWSNYEVVDALTGTPEFAVKWGPVFSTETITEDASGDLIWYYVNASVPASPLLVEWNSTQCICYPNGQQAGYHNWQIRPIEGAVYSWQRGIMWTAPLPTSYKGSNFPSTNGPNPTPPATLSISQVNSGVIVMTASSDPGLNFGLGWEIYAGYNANTGTQIWIENRSQTPDCSIATQKGGDGIFTECNRDTFMLYGLSMTTGAQLWATQLSTNYPYDSIGEYQSIYANGITYEWGFAGDIYAINQTNGAIIWQTTSDALIGPTYGNDPFGTWTMWTFTVGALGGGVLFLPIGHMYDPPLYHGAQQLAINATNGKLVWSIVAWDTTQTAICDGYVVTLNAYDNQLYCYGKGPTETSVSAPGSGVSTATPVTITGSVYDISSGSQQNAVAMNYPHGLPCASDASMSLWMEHVYMQEPMPSNFTGVPVTLTVTDVNHNTYVIGTTTTDQNGFFSYSWTPIVVGNYTITATFAGSEGYYGSSAESAFYASAPAPTAAPTASPPTGLASTGTVELGVAAIVIVIIIIGAVLAMLMLRKRPAM